MNSLDFSIATCFKNDLPPIVKAVTTAVIATLIHIFTFSLSLAYKEINLRARTAAQDPDTIPKLSPIKSQQIDDTFELFLTNVIAVFAPYSFLDAIDVNGAKSQDVTAIPTPSKKILTITKASNNMMDPINVVFSSVISEINANKAPRTKANKVIRTLYQIAFLFLILSFETFFDFFKFSFGSIEIDYSLSEGISVSFKLDLSISSIILKIKYF